MVYLVYYKYISGWKTTDKEIFEEINKEPILGIYTNYHKALLQANEWNIKYHLEDILEHGEYYGFDNNKIVLDIYSPYELEILYNKMIKEFESKTYKYTFKYCVFKEWSIEN